jgi:subtilisin family serine protease
MNYHRSTSRLLRRSICTALALASLLTTAGRAEDGTRKVDPWVLDQLAAPAAESDFLIVLAEQADVSSALTLHGKEAKGERVVALLRATAVGTQGPILAMLAAEGIPYRALWVANMIWARGDAGLVTRLAARPDVARIAANPRVRVALPAMTDAGDWTKAIDAVETNLTHVRAPEVWAAGFTGQGVVVGNQDTGMDWDHPALKNQYRGWNGASASHAYNWHDSIHSNAGANACGANSPEPCDDHGHGTATTGIAVGSDGAANQIGMAPGAKWIGCRNMDAGVGTPESYAECFQFFLAPTDLAGANPNPALAPDVINNSWGCPSDEGCTDPNVLRTVVENTRAAGIVVVASSGNDGPSCSTIYTPAAIYDASFTVGSTLKTTDGASSFSSRGPVLIDGSNRLKPDISAPGSSIRSSSPGGGYGTGSGTSFSSPHVAGLVALMISAEPGLAGEVDAIEELIRSTAVHPVSTQTCGDIPANTFPNNTFGHGRIDARAAVPASPGFLLTSGPPQLRVCPPANAVFDVHVVRFQGFAESITLGASGQPAGTAATFGANPVTPPAQTTMTVSNTGAAALGSYPITVTGTASGGSSHQWTVSLAVDAAPAAVALSSPADGATGVSQLPTLSWSATPQATAYDVQVAADAGFTGVVFSNTVGGTAVTLGSSLQSAYHYFWRVRGSGACGPGPFSAPFSFTTGGIGFLFADGFENGGTSAWLASP